MLTTDEANHDILRESVSVHQRAFHNEVLSRATQTFQFYQPPSHFTEYNNKFEELWRVLSLGCPQNIDDALLPYLKTAFLNQRRQLANDIERQLVLTTSTEFMASLEERLRPYSRETTKEWFKVTPARMPRLTDILSLERVEAMLLQSVNRPSRQYDEKFHVLQAPQLFIPDLDYQRRRCEIRDVPLCVAFLDIDDFKAFNSAHGETYVDRHVLLPFVTALEGHVFSHGEAYRYAGDEYAIIYANMSKELATLLLYRFRDVLAEKSYHGCDKKISVTAGLVEVTTDCPLTNREILQRAENAKNFGKQHEKSLVYGFTDEMMTEPTCLLRSRF